MVLSTFVTIAATPARAYADDGFLGGLQDLVGAREVEGVQDYESEYLDEYNPQLRADPPDAGTNTLTELDEDSTTVDYVNGTLDEFNKLPWGSGTRFSWLQSVQLVFGARNGANVAAFYLIPAVGLVFMWWGVRKSVKMLMSGFRKGSMNI